MGILQLRFGLVDVSYGEICILSMEELMSLLSGIQRWIMLMVSKQEGLDNPVGWESCLSEIFSFNP